MASRSSGIVIAIISLLVLDVKRSPAIAAVAVMMSVPDQQQLQQQHGGPDGTRLLRHHSKPSIFAFKSGNQLAADADGDDDVIDDGGANDGGFITNLVLPNGSDYGTGSGSPDAASATSNVEQEDAGVAKRYMRFGRRTAGLKRYMRFGRGASADDRSVERDAYDTAARWNARVQPLDADAIAVKRYMRFGRR